MNKQQSIQHYIKEETGIDISKNLLAFVMNPKNLKD